LLGIVIVSDDGLGATGTVGARIQPDDARLLFEKKDSNEVVAVVLYAMDTTQRNEATDKIISCQSRR
jgi:hypothetical protein